MATELPPLFRHQEQTVKLLLEQPAIFDCSDPGTGKTRSGLEGWSRRGNKALLVVAPKTILQPAWGNDIAKFYPEARYSIAYAYNREETFQRDADIYITNTDATKWLASQSGAFFDKFDSIIVDESCDFKNRAAQRTKGLIAIADYFPFKEILTGTPNPNTILEIWSQVFFLDKGRRLGTNYFKFRNAVCEPQRVGAMPNAIRWVDKPGSHEAVSSCIKDITIRHVFEECVDIPPNVERFVSYMLNDKHHLAYREMEQNAILALDSGNVTAVNAAVLRSKLLQIASGAVYNPDGTYTLLDRDRYELAVQLVTEHLPKQSIVFFIWKHQRDLLAETMEREGIPFGVIDGSVSDTVRQRLVEKFQGGEIKVLLLHPKTAAHGLTLTRGTRSIWVSPIYAANVLEQGIHRIYRAGQTEKTETIMIEAIGTCERKVFERKDAKQDDMDSFRYLLK